MAYKHPITGKFISKKEYESLSNTKPQVPDLRQLMASYTPQAVSGMVQRLNHAFADREAFELSKNPHGSHIELRRARPFLTNNRRLAAFCLALNVDPDLLINRERKAGTRADLKGLNRKLKNLVDYITGKTSRFERVSLALFASTIIAANRGIGWISNNEQELILSNLPVSSLPDEVQEAIEEYKHKYMAIEGDSRHQACRWRTTYENVGAYFITNEDTAFSNENGVSVMMESPLIDYLSKRWQLDAVS